MGKSLCRNVEARSAPRRKREQLTINKRQLFCQGRRGVKVIPLDFLNTLVVSVSLSSDVTTTYDTEYVTVLEYYNRTEHRVKIVVLYI